MMCSRSWRRNSTDFLENFSPLVFVHDAREWSALAQIAHLFAVFDQASLEIRNWKAQEFLPLLCPSVIHGTFDRKPSTDPLPGSTQQLDIQPLDYEPVKGNTA